MTPFSVTFSIWHAQKTSFFILGLNFSLHCRPSKLR